MVFNIALFVLGIGLLYAGGEIFIKGSTSLARIFGLKPLIIAVTVAAFATSAPEFFVCLIAAVKDTKGLVLGNIIGSCIANIALVLGICSLIKPIKIERSMLRKELPILIAASILMLLVCLDLYISRIEAFFMLLGFCLFLYYCIKNAKKEALEEVEDLLKPISKIKSFIFLIIATLLLVGGAHFLVKSAMAIAHYAGISPLVIGLTVVALGTSLPELSVSAVASAKGKHETSIGNIIGSNVFNILLIIGTVCLIRPVFVPLQTIRFEIPLMVAYSILLLPLFRTGFQLSRIEGLGLLISYGFYVFVLFNR